MKKGVSFLLVLLVSLLLVSSFVSSKRLSREDLYISHVYIGDYGVIYPEDDYLFALVSVHNRVNTDLDNLKVEITIDELDIYARSQLFDLDEKDDRNDHKRSVLIYEHFEKRPSPGMYYARIVIENDDVRRVLHRPVWILG
jgi:hypothetical protein